MFRVFPDALDYLPCMFRTYTSIPVQRISLKTSVVTVDIIDVRQSNDYFQTIRSLGKNELRPTRIG